MFSVTIREKSGQVYTFHFDKPEIMIGRVKGNDVILPKQNISKRHALVRVHSARFIVEDLGSTNGTYVNGHRITTPVEVGSEDKVYLGDFVMQFFDLGPSEAASDAGAAPDVADAPAAEPVLDLPPTDEVASAPVGGAEAADFDFSAALDGEVGDVAFEAEPGAALDALDESTLAQLGGAAADARAEIAARRASASEVGIAATDPNLVDVNDDRMTGPVDGLGAALDLAAQSAIAAPELSLDLSMPEEPQPAPVVMTTAQGDAFVPPTEHYAALELLHGAAVEALAGTLSGDAAQLSDAEWSEMETRVVAFVDERAAEVDPGLDLDRLKRDLIYELVGLGPLEALLDDAGIEAIEVNGPEDLWVQREGERQPCDARFSGPGALASTAERLVRASGASDGEPWVDGTLADGTTVRVVWPPLCPSGPVLLIRKPRQRASSVDELVERGVVAAEAATLLRQLLSDGRSIAIAGASGSGRRTVLNALAAELPDTERIVVTERGIRLHLEQPQVIRLDTGVSDDALRIAGLMHPDRLLLGECDARTLGRLITRAGDGMVPWLGFLHAGGAEDALDRAMQVHAVQHPGVPAAIAAARIAQAFDVVAAFSYVEGGAVLDRVVEVVLEGETLRAVELPAQSE